MGDAGLASLGNNPNFRNISLSECNQITDVGIQKMCSRFVYISHPTRYKQLVLGLQGSGLSCSLNI